MHIKGLSKALRNPTHSKFWKKMDFTGLGRQLNKARRHLGLTRSKLMSGLGVGPSSLNSAGAVMPSHLGSNRSVTEMF